MLSALLCPGFLLACQMPCTAPAMTNLVSSYPYGEQLSMDLTADGSLAFVAEGAAITFLHMPPAPWSSTPTVIQTLDVPDIQPLALRYFHSTMVSPNDWLFVAGGSHGLWGFPLCTSLISTFTACPSFTPVHIDSIEGGFFQRKRCVSIAVDGQSSLTQRPVLYALFAAGSDQGESAIGRTQLRAYDLNGTTFSLLASVEMPLATITPSRSQKGTCLATDIGVHDLVYVGMGKGGIWQAQLVGGAGNYLFIFPTSSPWLPSTIDNVMDMAIVRSTVGGQPRAVLYAALNYGSVAEVDLISGSSSVRATNVCGYPAQIAAVSVGSHAYVALAHEISNGKYQDAGAPYSVNGLWTGICLEVGFNDPDAPTIVCDKRHIAFFDGDLTQSITLGAQSLKIDIQIPEPSTSTWSALRFPANPAGPQLPLYENSGHYGTHIRTIDTTNWTATAHTPWVGRGYGATDATVSLLNSGVIRCGLENAGQVRIDGYLAYIDQTSPYSIQLIAGTRDECSGGFPGASCCGTQTNAGAYGGNLMSEAGWIEPGTSREWFLPARAAKVRFTDINPTQCQDPQGNSCSPLIGCNNCPQIPDCTSPWYPCVAGQFAQHTFWRSDPKYVDGTHTDNGIWQLSAHILPGSGTVPVASSIDPRWELMPLPWAPAQPPIAPEEKRSSTVTYSQSICDPRRTLQGYPTAVYGIRGGTNFGIQVFKPNEITLVAQNSACSTGSPWNGGYGERLKPDQISYRQVFTRIDLESLQGAQQCWQSTLCLGSGASDPNPRVWFQNRGDIYRTRTPQGAAMYALVLAAGFQSAMQIPGSGTTCRWKDYNGYAAIMIYDITHTGDGQFAAPQLLRVGTGTTQGHAFAVRTKTYGTGTQARTYAFVADITGTLLVFDVTGDQLFPAPASGQPYLPGTAVLQPIASATITTPQEPYDGRHHNIIDLDIDGDYLYCAMGRGGLGIVNISDALHPSLSCVLDTPGLAEGVAIRTTVGSNPHKQLIVCDSRCGLRLYEQ